MPREEKKKKQAEEKKRKNGMYTGTKHGKRSGHKIKKFTEGESLQSSRVFCGDLASTSLQEFEGTFPITQHINCSSMPHLVDRVDKGEMVDVQNALHL